MYFEVLRNLCGVECEIQVFQNRGNWDSDSWSTRYQPQTFTDQAIGNHRGMWVVNLVFSPPKQTQASVRESEYTLISFTSQFTNME